MSRGDEVTRLQARGISVEDMAAKLDTTPQRVARALRQRGFEIACVSTEHGVRYSNGTPCEVCGGAPPVDRYKGKWICDDCLNPPEDFEALFQAALDHSLQSTTPHPIEREPDRVYLHTLDMCRQMDRKFVENGWPLMSQGGQLVRND